MNAVPIFIESAMKPIKGDITATNIVFNCDSTDNPEAITSCEIFSLIKPMLIGLRIFCKMNKIMNNIIIITFKLRIKNKPAIKTNETPTIKVLFTAIDRDGNLFFNFPEFLEAHEVNMYIMQ